MMRWTIVAMLVLSAVAPVFAGEKAEAGPDEARIQRLIEALGSERWKEREKATDALVEIGEAAVPALTQALQSEDPEVRVRARDALERIRKASPSPAGKEEGDRPRGKEGKGWAREPFPVPDPWGSDFSDWLKKFLGPPEVRQMKDLAEWERRIRERMKKLMGEDFPGFEEDEDDVLDLEKLLARLRERGVARDAGVQKHVISKDGKRVEVSRDATGRVQVVIRHKDEAGEETVERYEAPSEKAFREKHPDLWKAYVKNRLSNFRIRILPHRDLESWRKRMQEDLERFRKRFDPEAWRKEMEERFRRAREEARERGGERASNRSRVSVTFNGEGIVLERGRDGSVALTVKRRGEKGKLIEERYEAASEEAFRETHPGVWEKYVKGRLGKDGVRIELGRNGWPFERRDDLGLEAGEVTELMRVHLGLEAGQGFVVRAVRPSSRAARAGIRKWDLVVKADGKRVSGLPDLRAALEKADGPVSLDIIRKGERATLLIDDE